MIVLDSKWLVLLLIALFFLAWGLLEAGVFKAPVNCDGHALGESWLADDGCNTCFCSEAGAACTLMACVEPCVDECGNGACEEVVCEAIGCPCAETAESCPEDCKSIGLANPASVHCIDEGGELEMRENELGTYGVCIFPDGECEEWALFKGECDPEKPEIAFCYENNGVIEDRLDEEEVAYSVCLLPGGECEALAFYDGECTP